MNRIKRVNEIFLLTVAAAVAGSFLIGIINGIFGGNELVTLLVSQVVFFLPTAFYLWENKFDLKETIRLHPIKISTAFLLIVFMYLLIPAITMVNAISLKFTTNTIDTTITGIADEYPLAVGLFIIAVIPSVLEECVYRGVFFNEYRKVSPGKAIVLSGLLFGLAHMNFNQFIYAFLLGMIFSIVVEATDSILSSMVLHFVMNGTSIVTIYEQKALEGTEAFHMAAEQSMQTMDAYIRNGWPAAVGGAILAFFVLKLIAENQGREQELETLFKRNSFEREEDLKLTTVALWIAIAVCLGIMFLIEVTG